MTYNISDTHNIFITILSFVIYRINSKSSSESSSFRFGFMDESEKKLISYCN